MSGQSTTLSSILVLALGLSLASACSTKDGSDTSSTTAGDGGSDGGSASDGGGDGGDGGGSGSDGGGSGTTDGIDCDNPPAPSTVGGPDCVTDTLSCDTPLIDTTKGGTSTWDGDAYEAWFCMIASPTDYTGPERVYAFDHPGTGTVTFTLDSPCENLDLIGVRWSDEESCPQAGYSINECEGSDESGNASDSFTIWNNEPSRYLIVVDAPDGSEAPFRLTASCP